MQEVSLVPVKCAMFRMEGVNLKQRACPKVHQQWDSRDAGR